MCSAKADLELLQLETALGFCKNMSQRPKGFQDNLDTTIIKNSPDWFRHSLNARDYCKTLTAESPSGELQSVKVGRLKQSWRKFLGIVFFQNIGHILRK